MNRIKAILFRAVVLAIPVGMAGSLGEPSTARADYVVVYPPADYIATATPEYYEGRAVYYYHSQWFYRDGRHWRYYRAEPGYLRERRAHWAERQREREREREHQRERDGRYHYHR